MKIPDKALDKFKFHYAPSSTPYLQCRSLHTNIVVPTLYEMGDLAEIIHQLIKNGEQIYTFLNENKKNAFIMQ